MLSMILALAVAAGDTGPRSPLDDVAQAYVRLVLALGVHDADYVDAYYGPPEWRAKAQADKRPLPEIRADAEKLLAGIKEFQPPRGKRGSEEELIALRHVYLTHQLQSLVARTEILSGKKLSFDEESRALYNAVAPTVPESRFKEVVARLEGELPGSGTLEERYTAYRKAFVLPPDKVDAVFQAAIAECRRRTLSHI